jgi:hypothetical protein
LGIKTLKSMKAAAIIITISAIMSTGLSKGLRSAFMGGVLHTPDVAEGNTVPGLLSSLPEEQRNQRNVWDDRPFPAQLASLDCNRRSLVQAAWKPRP